QKALAIHREKAIDQKEEGVDLSTLGQIAQTRGDFEEAERYYEQSLAIRRKLDKKNRGEGMDLCFLGMTKLARGQLEKAEKDFKQSLAILLDKDVRERAYEGVVRSELGRLAYLRGQRKGATRFYGMAERYYQEARTIALEGNDPLTQCVLFPRI